MTFAAVLVCERRSERMNSNNKMMRVHNFPYYIILNHGIMHFIMGHCMCIIILAQSKTNSGCGGIGRYLENNYAREHELCKLGGG